MDRSPNEVVEFAAQEEFEGVTVKVAPLTEPERVKLLGLLAGVESGRQNVGEVALKVCQKQVVGWDGLPVDYVSGRSKLDRFPAELMLQVLAFVATKSSLEEDDVQD